MSILETVLPRRVPRTVVDPMFVEAVRLLVRRRFANAEIVRALQGMTTSVGKPAPSYWTVRRIADAERRRLSRPDPDRERMIEELLAGRIPRMYGSS